MLRGLRNFLNTDNPEHHSLDRLKERGVEKGSDRHSTLRGLERSVFNQTNIGAVSRATLGRLLRGVEEGVWAFPSATLFVGCLSSQQHACVSQGRICSDNFTCCHTETEAADQTFHLTQSHYTDTGPTSPSADPITPGAWQGSHWSANF